MRGLLAIDSVLRDALSASLPLPISVSLSPSPPPSLPLSKAAEMEAKGSVLAGSGKAVEHTQAKGSAQAPVGEIGLKERTSHRSLSTSWIANSARDCAAAAWLAVNWRWLVVKWRWLALVAHLSGGGQRHRAIVRRGFDPVVGVALTTDPRSAISRQENESTAELQDS